jgi:hypothetical protein
MSTSFRYYVYAYLRPDGSPYYIGKGTGNRTTQKHSVKIPKDKSRIVFLEKNLSNVGACALERRYIEWYGRKNNGSGILRNVTAGGDGIDSVTSSEIMKKRHREKNSVYHTTEYKEKQSKIIRALHENEDSPYNTEEYKNLRREIMARLCENPEFRSKLVSQAKDYLVTSPTGQKHTINNLKKFCRDKNLSYNVMRSIPSGRKKSYKGWTCKQLSVPNSEIA